MKTYRVRHFMSVLPQRIASTQTLAEAHKVMRENRIRHLPVVDNRQLVGVVSMGDLHLLETLDGVDPNEVLVEDAMTANPFTVGPDALLGRTAATMADHRFGSALVVWKGEVIGVFTALDALRVLANLLPAARRKATAPARPRPAARTARAKAKPARARKAVPKRARPPRRAR